MKITDIQPQAKHKNRVSIFIDGKFAFGMEEADRCFMGLKIGTELTEERYSYIIDNIIYTKAYQKADRFIGFKMRTEKEVRDKLTSEDFSQDIVDRVVASMLKYKYIDDEGYARMYTRDCINLKKWGPQRIKAELCKRGISTLIAERAVSEAMPEDNSSIIASLIEKKIKNTPLDLKEKQKIINFLLRRGFNYNDIKTVIEDYC